MAYTNIDVYDAALNVIKNNADKMVLTDGEPTSFINANTNNGSGSGQKIAEVSMTSSDYIISDGDNSGDRKIESAAKPGQSVVSAGDGSHVAYLDTNNEKILHYYSIKNIRTGLTTDDSVNFPSHPIYILATEEVEDE